MRNIPMELLRSFVTVVEMGGFTVAGQLLGKSQPAVSLQIKRLEELIGAQVFVRGSHRLELTQPGERMLDYARQILALNPGHAPALTALTQAALDDNDPKLAEAARLFRNHGMPVRYQHLEWGLNLRMTDLQAAIARLPRAAVL